MESSVLEKSQVATLTLLTLSFMVGEVAHFLPTVTRSILASLVSIREYEPPSAVNGTNFQVLLLGLSLDWSDVNYSLKIDLVQFSHLVSFVIC